jgi:DnaD/phage-associated family protein
MLDINLPQTVGHLHFLWWWALDYAEDGDLTAFYPEDIADAAIYEGDADKFLEALESVGFVDNLNGTLHLHDWHDYAGKLLSRRDKNKERMKAARATNVRDTCNAQDAHVQDTCVATVPNQTVPNSTIQKDKNISGEVIQIWEQGTGQVISSADESSLSVFFEKGMDIELLRQAIIRAKSQGVVKARYCKGILKNWQESKILTLADLEARESRTDTSGTESSTNRMLRQLANAREVAGDGPSAA